MIKYIIPCQYCKEEVERNTDRKKVTCFTCETEHRRMRNVNLKLGKPNPLPKGKHIRKSYEFPLDEDRGKSGKQELMQLELELEIIKIRTKNKYE
jgi:hypothetical protein